MSKIPTDGPSSPKGKTNKTDKTSDNGYNNLEGKSFSYPKGGASKLSPRQHKLMNKPASSFKKTKTHKSKNKNHTQFSDEDDIYNNSQSLHKEERRLDTNLSGSGFSRQDKRFEDIEDEEDEDELDLEDMEAGSSGQDSQGQKNKENVIEFFRKFLEEFSPTPQQKKKMQQILFSMLKQCVAGLEVFAPNDPRHISLGKSANICKHALSALSRDNFIEAKKLIKIITPKK